MSADAVETKPPLADHIQAMSRHELEHLVVLQRQVVGDLLPRFSDEELEECGVEDKRMTAEWMLDSFGLRDPELEEIRQCIVRHLATLGELLALAELPAAECLD